MCAVEWIKLNLGMFDNAKLKIINAMAERDSINYIWVRLLIQAGKVNDKGKIYINKKLPYTLESLSVVLDRPEAMVKSALDKLCELDMIIIDENKIISIKNWAKYQNVDGLEKSREQSRQRMRKMRARKKAENQNKNEDRADFTDEDKESYVSVTEDNEGSYVTVTPKNKKENKNKKNIDIDLDKKERDKEKDDSVTLEEKVVALQDKKIEKVNEEALDILSYYENLMGKVGIFKLESIALAVSMYGKKNVKNAIDRALQNGKISMRYVNGILKNWAKEGYPEEGGSLSGKNGFDKDGSKFEGLKLQKPRELTEEDRERAKDLI